MKAEPKEHSPSELRLVFAAHICLHLQPGNEDRYCLLRPSHLSPYPRTGFETPY